MDTLEPWWSGTCHNFGSQGNASEYAMLCPVCTHFVKNVDNIYNSMYCTLLYQLIWRNTDSTVRAQNSGLTRDFVLFVQLFKARSVGPVDGVSQLCWCAPNVQAGSLANMNGLEVTRLSSGLLLKYFLLLCLFLSFSVPFPHSFFVPLSVCLLVFFWLSFSLPVSLPPSLSLLTAWFGLHQTLHTLQLLQPQQSPEPQLTPPQPAHPWRARPHPGWLRTSGPLFLTLTQTLR